MIPRIKVSSRAYRALRRVGRFSFVRAESAERFRALLGLGEEAVGLYRNTESDEVPELLITSQGIHLLRRHRPVFVAYSDISNLDIIRQDDVPKAFSISLSDGTTVELPVIGGEGRVRDIFAVHVSWTEY